LMMSPFSARQLYYKPAADVRTNYVLQRVMFLADCNLLDSLPKVDGFFSLALRDTDKVLWLFEAPTTTAQQLDRLENFLSVSQTIAPGKVFDWVARTNYIPIVSVGQQPVFASDTDAFDAIASGYGDFRNKVYLPLEAKSEVKASHQPSARIISKSFSALRQKIDLEAPANIMLVLTEGYYHDWKAQVDGKSARLWRANYAFEAVEVPAGHHEVVLVYQDEAFQVGLVVSLFSLALCVGGWLATGSRVGTG
jgi:hypothetical protein